MGKVVEFVTIPSGVDVSIDRPDFSKLKTPEDFLEVKCALQEKIIDIELQIDMFTSGAGVAAGRSYDLSWLPRATAALKWAKLYREECQARQGLFGSTRKNDRQHTLERCFVDVAKRVLGADEFTRILDEAISEARTK